MGQGRKINDVKKGRAKSLEETKREKELAVIKEDSGRVDKQIMKTRSSESTQPVNNLSNADMYVTSYFRVDSYEVLTYTSRQHTVFIQVYRTLDMSQILSKSTRLCLTVISIQFCLQTGDGKRL